MFSDGPRFLGRVGIARQAPPFAQRRLGVVHPDMNVVLDRIRADMDAMGRVYERNAAIPVQFPHVSAEYQAAAEIADRLWRNVVDYQRNPDDPRWGLPPSSQDLAALDDLERRVADMERKLTAYEAQARTVPPPAPEPVPAGRGMGMGQVVGLAAGALAVFVVLGEITGVTNMFGLRK